MNILLLNGHGAGDEGASGNGYKEYKLTRELADLVQERLKKYATVYRYPKDRNAYYDVQNGTFDDYMPIAFNKIRYALEIHFNAFKKSEVIDGILKGSECFVTYSEDGITVEQAIMRGMKKFFPLRDNDNIFDGVKRTNFAVIQTLKNYGVSGALLETCFIDDKDDITKYQENKNAIADAIVNGIVEGFGLKKTSGGTTEKPAEKPSNQAKPSGKIVVGSTVRPIKAVSYDGVKLASFVTDNNYPVIELKEKRAVLGNGLNTAFNVDNLKLVSGGSTSSSNTSKPKTLKVGMKAKPKKAVSYDGVKLISDVTKKYYKVIEIKGKRVVLDKIMTAFNIDNLTY